MIFHNFLYVHKISLFILLKPFIFRSNKPSIRLRLLYLVQAYQAAASLGLLAGFFTLYIRTSQWSVV